jgi:tetratricopeptide (TPR) repeat protein
MNNLNESLLEAQHECSEGNILFGKKLFEKALEYYDKAIDLNSNYFQAYFNKGSYLSLISLITNFVFTFS